MKKLSYAVIIFLIVLLNVSFSYAKIPEIVLQQKNAVVTIYINDKDGKQIATGTGFIIDSNGIIATNYHIVSRCLEDNNTLLIKMENGASSPLSDIVNFDKKNDVAIFKIDGKELPIVKIARNYKPKKGRNIVVVGSPSGMETTVLAGIISSIHRKGGIIQITAPISPGSSGSPVFNSKGEVIGVATFNIIRGKNLNFAIPVKHVADLLKGTKKPKKKEIVNSEPLPAVKPVPPSQELTAVEWVKKALALWVGENITDPLKAIEYLNHAITLQPKFADAYGLRGLVYAKLGQYQRAIEDLSEAIRLNADDAVSYKNRGVAYTKLGQHQRAIEDLSEAIRLKPDDASSYSMRGSAYATLGQYNKAHEDFNKTITLRPNDSGAYYNYACMFALQKNAAQACKWLQSAIERGYNNWEHIKEDKDFDNIRDTACFIDILNKSGK